MSRFPALALVLALALAAACLRAEDRNQGLASASARALALRRVELTLATGFVPREDRFLAHPHGLELPRPRLLEGALARAANAFLPANQGEPALRGIDATALARFAGYAAQALAVAAALAAWAASRALGCARSCAWIAPAAFALMPALVAHARAHPLGGAALEALTLFTQVALAASVLRAREPADRLMAALGLGLAAGLGALASPGGGLVPAVTLACLAFWSLREPGLRAPAVLSALVALTVLALGGGLPWSSAEAGSRALWFSSWQAGWWRVAVVPLAALIVLRDRAQRESAFLLILLAAAAVGAALSSRWISTLDLLGCILAAQALAALQSRRTSAPRASARLAPAVLGLFLVPALIPGETPPPRPPRLEFLRRATPSSGPWSHPQAVQDFAVLTLPSCGALVAHEGRRPVLAVASEPMDAAEREIYLLFLQRSPTVFVAAARARGVRYVLVRRGMESEARLTRVLEREPDLPGVAGSILQRLLDPSGVAVPGLVQVPTGGEAEGWLLFEVSTL